MKAGPCFLNDSEEMLGYSRSAMKGSSGKLAALLLVAALGTVGFGAPARAQKGQAAETKNDYKKIVREAIEEFSLGNWSEARALFQRAHDLNPSARTLRGLGMVAFELRNYVDAVRLLAASLEDPRNPLTLEHRKQVEELLTRARTFVGSFNIKMSPPGGELTVDDAPAQPSGGGPLLLDIGKHTLVVVKGGDKQTRVVDVRGGEQETLTFTPGTAAVPGSGAQKNATTAPAASDSGARGEGGSAVPYVMLGVGGALLIGAGVTGFMALGAQSDLEEKCPDRKDCAPNMKSTRSRAKTLGIVTDVLWIGGALAAGAGLIWILAGGDGEEGAGIETAAVIGPAGSGVVVRGTF